MDHAYLYRTLLERCRAALTEYQASRDFEALIASLEATMTEAEVQIEEEEKYRDAQAEDAQHTLLRAMLADPEPTPTLAELREVMDIADQDYRAVLSINLSELPPRERVDLDMTAAKLWGYFWLT